MLIRVDITFQSNAQRRFLAHNGNFVPIGSAGTATIQCQQGDTQLLLYGIEGAPGSTGTITLRPQSPHKLLISSHPIQIRIAQGKTLAGGSRFFVVQ